MMKKYFFRKYLDNKMGFNKCQNNLCDLDCSDCPIFAVFSSNVSFVDYLEAARFNKEGSKYIHTDENGNIRIEKCGVYFVIIRILASSRSSWALFEAGLPDKLLPYTFLTNALSEETLLRQSYSLDDRDILTTGSFLVVNSPTTYKLVNITGDEQGRAGVDFTGAKVSNTGFMVKVFTENNVVAGKPFPGITAAFNLIG